MIFALDLDLDMVKIYHHTKNEVSVSTASKVTAQTDGRQTNPHTRYENITSTHTRWVKRQQENMLRVKGFKNKYLKTKFKKIKMIYNHPLSIWSKR